MELPIYQIDSFASAQFKGNPAAVCPLEQWLPDTVMQAIASENNLSETAFFVPADDGYHIRWFTPVSEVDLCGHATLATAYVLFNFRGVEGDRLRFESRSGPLQVARSGDRLTLDFPAQPPSPRALPSFVAEAFGMQPVECLASEDLILVFEDESQVRKAAPAMDMLMQSDWRGVIITAPSERWDFVARFFAPAYGIPEDPVTGSAYTQLGPYWAERLGKSSLRAMQLSARGGEVGCELTEDRVLISGTAVPYMQGTITIDS